MTDEGSILFPSVTICKNEMFDNFDGLIKKLQTNETSVKNARFLFRNSTFSRTRLVKFLREVVTTICLSVGPSDKAESEIKKNLTAPFRIFFSIYVIRDNTSSTLSPTPTQKKYLDSGEV